MTRLKMVDYIKKHSMIKSIPIKNPIFVVGFPRTGTTFLHEILGLHPQVKSHTTWQQMNSVPDTHIESAEALLADMRLRYKNNKLKFNVLMGLAGNAIQRVHRIGYDEPEECTSPCAMELPWTLSEIPW